MRNQTDFKSHAPAEAAAALLACAKLHPWPRLIPTPDKDRPPAPSRPPSPTHPNPEDGVLRVHNVEVGLVIPSVCDFVRESSRLTRMLTSERATALKARGIPTALHSCTVYDPLTPRQRQSPYTALYTQYSLTTV